ncbi:MAG TPA: glycine/sarcosine/betaine reductase component B subunit [Candidatus Binataceae bacterium]|nr:glycine/sarcosine/betaine reductase component B subunit [Candidatus Binataceae bacterium]
MRLELQAAAVHRVIFGNATGLEDGTLTIARDELRALLSVDSRLADLEIELANPGEDCRITDIFDVFEPRFKSAGPNFPGVIEPIGRVGDGPTTVARGAAVMVLNAMADRYKLTVDMIGPSADFSPYSHTANVCVRSKPAPNLDRAGYYRALKEAGIRAAAYLGQAASRAKSDAAEVLSLDGSGTLNAGGVKTLPRVAYIYMLASQQMPTEANEPILYGDNVRTLLPTVLHPNEVLDGAVVAPYWNFGGDTYAVQNHPMIHELYRRHGRDLTFAGVIGTIAAETEVGRTRSAVMAANLARDTLGADAVVLTKYGGGIPEAATMETYDACEALGMKGAIVIWTHGGDGRIDGALTFMSPRADAVVSCGINEQGIDLPPVARVIGSSSIGPLIMETEGDVRPSNGPLHLRFLFLAGAADQLGGGRRSIEEY